MTGAPQFSVVDLGGGAEGVMPPGPVKISHKKMATKGSRIDFMFLAPPIQAAGSATDTRWIFVRFVELDALVLKTSSVHNYCWLCWAD